MAGLETFLADLHQQVRVYDSDHALETLVIGDATAVVGWSDDSLPLLKQYRHLAVAVPPQGTLLSAQLWVRPQAESTQSPRALNWLDFCLDGRLRGGFCLALRSHGRPSMTGEGCG